MTEGPLADYRARISTGDLNPDPVQALAVEKLQSLYHALAGYKPLTGLAGWKARFGLNRRTEGPPQGLYIYGGVGRGKSMLMDMFFRNAAVERKRRVHFHAFMQQIHERLTEYRKKPGRAGDPIPSLAARLVEESWLLCFDEFQVQDIADAMILGRLFEALFKAGVVVVATSNHPPRSLYKDGLQRDLFLPFVDLIEEKLDLLELAGNTDYRMETIRNMNVYITPNDAAADRELGRCFSRLTNDAPANSDGIVFHRRRIEVPMAVDGVALASFDDLCSQPLGPGDYLEIARRYHTLVMPGIPRLQPSERDKAKRFLTLIDALYEHKVTLICSAETPPESIYPAGDGAFEFKRTASRLMEMQSEPYIKSKHID
ncbi:MAG: cell division protein ZapE [Rhodospirillales bacterium]|nr:cell division protein ZapE [Rhodospirillales bacterium]